MDKLVLRRKEKESLALKLRNVNLNDCTEAFLGIVHDKQQGTIFYDYEPKAKIGRSIYAELLDQYREGAGFILSDDFEEVGILSQAQGASSLDTLITRFGVISVLSKQDALQLKDIYEKTIRDILARIRGGDEGGYLFNSTPYNVNAFDRDYAYMDTITWVISAFLGAISLHNTAYAYVNAREGKVQIAFSEDEMKAMLDAIAYGVRYMKDSYIDVLDKKDNCLARGWNFTSGCSEPSLYFTFAVSECYLDLYNVFQQVIDWHNIGKKIERVKADLQHRLSNPEDFWMYISPDDRAAYEKIIVNTDDFRRWKQYFDIINCEDDCFYVLERQVKDSAKNAWSLVRDGIDRHFCNYNLSAWIDPQAIESSSSSDALFNNIFVINNVISGGLDEDLLDRLANAEDDEEMNRIQGEYDDLLETLQAAVQRMIRYSKTLRSKRKEYIINDYIVSCSESFEGEMSRKAQELRKKRIKTFTVSPLLVKTNNLISEYLTKYPQIDMIKYLDEMIMRKRTLIDDATDENEHSSSYIWIWENGEYMVTTNYYYILSLASFYEYVDNYESRFSSIDRNNARFKEALIAKHDEESRTSGPIFQLTTEVEELRQNEALLNRQISELESRKSEVEETLRSFLRKELKNQLLPELTECLRESNEEIITALSGDNMENADAGAVAFLTELQRTLVMVHHQQIRHRLCFTGADKGKAVILVEQMLKAISEEADERLTDIVNSKEFSERK